MRDLMNMRMEEWPGLLLGKDDFLEYTYLGKSCNKRRMSQRIECLGVSGGCLVNSGVMLKRSRRDLFV